MNAWELHERQGKYNCVPKEIRMRKLIPTFVLAYCVGVAGFIVATGCGESRPTIERPTNPTPPPDPSLQQQGQQVSSSTKSPQQQKQ